MFTNEKVLNLITSRILKVLDFKSPKNFFAIKSLQKLFFAVWFSIKLFNIFIACIKKVFVFIFQIIFQNLDSDVCFYTRLRLNVQTYVAPTCQNFSKPKFGDTSRRAFGDTFTQYCYGMLSVIVFVAKLYTHAQNFL